MVCFKLAAAIKSTQSAEGIASFRQDLLSVNFKNDSILDTLIDPETKGLVKLTANKYMLPYVIA